LQLARPKQDYIRANYVRFTDAQLGRALGVNKDLVRKVRDDLGLHRSREESDAMKRQGEVDAPEYSGMLLSLSSRLLDRYDLLLAFVVVVVALGVYVATLGPTVTGEDSGELITAAYTMGIAHPPAYPTWCMAGKLFTYIPYGTIAWRVNFMSAFFAAGTCFFLSLLTIKVTRSRLAALTAGLACAFSLEFWEQSTIAEVYTLNAFFMAACLYLLCVWYESRRTSLLLVFSLLYGLSLGNHNTMAFLGPLFIAFVLYIDREPWRRWMV
jgi:hypothetical protein